MTGDGAVDEVDDTAGTAHDAVDESVDTAPGEGERTSPDGDAGDRGDAVLGDGDRSDWGRPDWIAVGVLCLVSLVLVGLHVRAYPTLSPLDELQHVDYVIKAGEFAPPHRNDLVGFEAMSEAACRSVDAPGYVGPRCGLDAYDPEDFQENGVNTAASQFPPYYTVTGLASRGLQASGLFDSQVVAARMVGGVWAAAAWAVMWYLLSLLGVARIQRAVALAVFVVTPLTLFHAATVNADAVLMLTGALAVLATIQFERGRLHWFVLLASFVGLYLVEATTVLAMIVCAGYLLARIATVPGRSNIALLVPVAIVAIVAALRLRLARRVHDALLPPSPRTSTRTAGTDNATDGVDWQQVLAQTEKLFSPVDLAYAPPFLDNLQNFIVLRVTDWLVVAAMLIGAMGYAGAATSARIAWLMRLGTVVLIAAGPLYTWSFAYFSDQRFPAQGRFALPLIAVLVVGLASALTTRWARGVGAAVALLAASNTVWFLVTA